jgi:hypothetical protein
MARDDKAESTTEVLKAIKEEIGIFMPDDATDTLKMCIAGAALLAVTKYYGLKWPEFAARLRE